MHKISFYISIVTLLIFTSCEDKKQTYDVVTAQRMADSIANHKIEIINKDAEKILISRRAIENPAMADRINTNKKQHSQSTDSISKNERVIIDTAIEHDPIIFDQ